MNTATITHKERLEICISGLKPDRTPVSLWRHFPVDDQDPQKLAEATINFQDTYDFDFIKVTPASSYCIRDWGVEDRWEGNTEGTRVYTKRIIQNPDDWTNLKILEPNQGYLGQQLECLQLLRKKYSPGTPIIQTIFNPLAQAKNLAGNDVLVAHLREFPEAVHEGLKTITNSILRFIDELINMQLDGIFYAVQHAQYPIISEDEFAVFSKPYDLEILNLTKSLWFNLLHLHGTRVMFNQVKDYPITALNWHDQSTPPSLSEAQKLYPGIVCGGLRQWETMALGTPQQVLYESRNAIRETDGEKFILGTGCVTPIIAPHGNILAVKQAASEAV